MPLTTSELQLEDLPQEDKDEVIYVKTVSKRKRRNNSRTTAKEPDELKACKRKRCEEKGIIQGFKGIQRVILINLP